MNAVSFARNTLQMAEDWIGLIEDARSIPLQRPTPLGGNHPLWIVGHLAYSEAEMVHEMIEGRPNPLADWASLFGMSSEPQTDASAYPSPDEVWKKAREIRAHTLEVLGGMTDADLDGPSHGSEQQRQMFPTVGACLAALCIHYAFHGGQISDCRRAAGRGPLMG